MTRLTNDIRLNLASRLTLEAISVHAEPLASDVCALSAEAYEIHMREFSQLLPVPKHRIAKLIEARVLIPTQTFSVDGMKDGIRIDRDPASTERVRRLFSLVQESDAWRGFMEVAASRRFYHGSTFYVRCDVVLRLPSVVPDYAKTGGYSDLVRRFNGVIWRANEVFSEAIKYQEKLLDVLNACKTVKQLEDLIPEAVKYLPPAKKPSKALMPVELAASLREQLKTGVPGVSS